MISADNLQYLDRVEGKYDHYFTILYHLIPENVLREWGAYSPQATRQRGNWKKIVSKNTKEQLLASVYQPRVQDWE
eukprot:scaffold422213_cov59-Attheya_sp.AAC.1